MCLKKERKKIFFDLLPSPQTVRLVLQQWCAQSNKERTGQQRASLLLCSKAGSALSLGCTVQSYGRCSDFSLYEKLGWKNKFRSSTISLKCPSQQICFRILNGYTQHISSEVLAERYIGRYLKGDGYVWESKSPLAFKVPWKEKPGCQTLGFKLQIMLLWDTGKDI